MPQHQAEAEVVESSIIAAVSEALGAAVVGRSDNLMEMGVDSLVAARIVGRLRAEFGLDIPLLALFENPVIADFAEEIVVLAADASVRIG